MSPPRQAAEAGELAASLTTARDRLAKHKHGRVEVEESPQEEVSLLFFTTYNSPMAASAGVQKVRHDGLHNAV